MTAVGFDNTMLSLLLNPKCRAPVGVDGKPLLMAVRRAEYLVERLGKSRQKIIVPTPAVAEVLTAIGPDNQKWLEVVARSRLFEIAPFDYISAIELALLNRDILFREDKKNKAEPYQKVKTDRQIIAILKSRNVEDFYTDDSSLAKRASLCGITAISTHALPVPEGDRQMNIEFDRDDEVAPSKDDLDDESTKQTFKKSAPSRQDDQPPTAPT
jgi:predicted nucleic acid-binding protein